MDSSPSSRIVATDCVGPDQRDEPDLPPAANRSRRVPALYWQVAIAATVLHGLYLIQIRQSPTFSLPIVDAATYHQAATRLATGDGLCDGPFWQPPLFPLLLGALYAVFSPSAIVGRVACAALSVCNCVLICHLARSLFGNRAGWIAGCLACLNGTMLFFGCELLPVAPAICLNLLAFSVWVHSMRHGRAHHWLVTGLLIGLSTITVPAGVVLLPIVLLERVTRRGKGTRGRPRLQSIAWVLAGSAMPLAATTAYNYRVSGDFVLISTNGGINLFIGNNAQADQTLALRPGEHFGRLTRTETLHQPRSRAEQSSFFLRRVMNYAVDDPLGYLQGLGRKALRLVNGREIPRNVDAYVHRPYSSLLSVLLWQIGPLSYPFGVLAPIAAMGVLLVFLRPLRNNKSPKSQAMFGLIAFVVLYALFVIMFFVSARHRLPMVAFMIILAAGGVAFLWQSFAGSMSAPLSNRWRWAALSIFGLSLIVSNRRVAAPTDHVNFSAEMHLIVGNSLLQEGNRPRAEASIRRALVLDPNYATATARLGYLKGLQGAYDESESLLRRACTLDQSSAEGRRLLGDILAFRGDADAALVAYHDALRIDPGDPDANGALAELLIDTGRLEEAVLRLNTATRFTSEPARVQFRMGDVLTKLERYDDAIAHYRRGLRHGIPPTQALTRIVWLLATCPRAELRDCELATELAFQCCETIGFANPDALDALAAAHAECGRLSEAVNWGTRALELAKSSPDTAAANAIDARLKSYRNRLQSDR